MAERVWGVPGGGKRGGGRGDVKGKGEASGGEAGGGGGLADRVSGGRGFADSGQKNDWWRGWGGAEEGKYGRGRWGKWGL